jgi:hypothetical protein
MISSMITSFWRLSWSSRSCQLSHSRSTQRLILRCYQMLCPKNSSKKNLQKNLQKSKKRNNRKKSLREKIPNNRRSLFLKTVLQLLKHRSSIIRNLLSKTLLTIIPLLTFLKILLKILLWWIFGTKHLVASQNQSLSRSTMGQLTAPRAPTEPPKRRDHGWNHRCPTWSCSRCSNTF